MKSRSGENKLDSMPRGFGKRKSRILTFAKFSADKESIDDFHTI